MDWLIESCLDSLSGQPLLGEIDTAQDDFAAEFQLWEAGNIPSPDLGDQYDLIAWKRGGMGPREYALNGLIELGVS